MTTMEKYKTFVITLPANIDIEQTKVYSWEEDYGCFDVIALFDKKVCREVVKTKNNTFKYSKGE